MELTIGKTAADTITVSVTSPDADPVDGIVIGAMDHPAALSSMVVADGVASIEMYWPEGAPETTSFEVLWSKESNPGNWMINKDQLGQMIRTLLLRARIPVLTQARISGTAVTTDYDGT